MKIKQKILEIFDKIIPPKNKCLICSKEMFLDKEKHICFECENALKPIGKSCIKCGAELKDLSTICDFCKDKKREFKMAISCFNFDDFTRKIIHKFKYGFGEYLSPLLAKFMAEKVVDFKVDFDYILYVPMTEKSKRKRGYNQSKLLACEIGKILDKQVLNDVLFKIGKTKNQASLGYNDRLKNLRDSFVVANKDVLKGKKILLVDDVFTTGATAEEISRVLKLAKAKEVNVITFCHTLLD